MGADLRLCIRTNEEEFAEGNTQALMKIVVNCAIRFDPLRVPLEEVQD